LPVEIETTAFRILSGGLLERLGQLDEHALGHGIADSPELVS
jgi:hypothetical protein